MDNAKVKTTVGMEALFGNIPYGRIADEVWTNNSHRIRYRMVAAAFFIDVNGRWQLIHFITEGPGKTPADSQRPFQSPVNQDLCRRAGEAL